MNKSVLHIGLDNASQTPLFKQVAEQIQSLVASDQLHAGERLPPVRQLADSLGVSLGTAARAYGELEREGVIQSRRGSGTVITRKAEGERNTELRQLQLFNTIGSNILQALSLGFRPEEIEAAFSIHLARWREERQERQLLEKKSAAVKPQEDAVVVVASHDLALDLLVSQLKKSPGINIDVTYAGSLGGLIALQEERADLAGIHLLDGETGEYNYPYVRHILPNQETAILHLANRIQGLMFAKGNPKKIRGMEDLRRADVTFVNRQTGAGTRVLLDFNLRKLSINPREIKGYENAVDTHLAVARSVAKGKADVGLGIEAVARTFDLDFLPLFKERYDLIIPMEKYRSQKLMPILKTIRNRGFRSLVASIGGYETTQTGVVSFTSQ